MSENDMHGIQDGWTVKTTDGHSIGSVEETTDTYILVKSGLVNPARHYLPAAALEHVRPELKEIGIDLTQAEVTDGDWSEPPTDGPRSEGAPLNVDTDAEADAAMRNTDIEPERPADELSHRA